MIGNDDTSSSHEESETFDDLESVQDFHTVPQKFHQTE
jgi:hypothetical protein